jgi:hypothetical protein
MNVFHIMLEFLNREREEEPCKFGPKSLYWYLITKMQDKSITGIASRSFGNAAKLKYFGVTQTSQKLHS